MKLSLLQKFILVSCYNKGGQKIGRRYFGLFYSRDSKTNEKLRAKIITQSLENLIKKGFLLGHGLRTPQKWFIEAVSLTPSGLKLCQKLIADQKKLNLRFANNKKCLK
ncbi:MAG: hypothetical protein WCT18_04105 [Patescibacteria group bacterium]